MKTVSMVDLEDVEREFYSFECVYFESGGSVRFVIYGWYVDSYFRRDRRIVGCFLDLDTAVCRLKELNSQLDAAETEGVVV